MALYIGLMSGTSLDGVDGILVPFDDDYTGGKVSILSVAHVPFDLAFRKELMALQQPDYNEIEREAIAANRLASLYSENVRILLNQAGLQPQEIRAIGVHGQTIRHRPELGFTRQTNNPALLAETSQINVIADFRSRDVAAKGQGAPLVPAFHQAVFGNNEQTRAVINIGGIANISILEPNGIVSGFDIGPGNMLMDAWTQRYHNFAYDMDGQWAAQGQLNQTLLNELLSDPFFKKSPPKSTGRDLFNLNWLQEKINRMKLTKNISPVDTQTTLTWLTATSIVQAINNYPNRIEQAYICGGGAKNGFLMKCMNDLLKKQGATQLYTSEVLGIDPMHVEALAFAWLAHRFFTKRAGNLPAVTGASGLRILGALYPA